MKPITIEYIRRISILVLLALFSWMFFYTPSDIYNIQFQNYKEMHEIETRRGIVEPNISLEQYIQRKMQGQFWRSSPKIFTIFEAKGDVGEFLGKLVTKNKEELDNTFRNDNYFFRENDLPEAFLSNVSLRDADYISVTDELGEKQYFCLYPIQRRSSLMDAPSSIKYPLENYSYLLILLSILVYIFIPKPKVPQGAAYYTRLNAVYLADILGFFLWMFAWFFFFLPDDSAPLFVRYFFLSFFGIFALAIVLPTTQYASNWYLFTKDSFQWSDRDGIGKVSLQDIVSIKPYRRELSGWIAVLIVLFGRGKVGATGIGSLAASSNPEIGMEITTTSGKKIKVMANYLEADEVFTERFQDLEKRSKK